MAKKGIQKTIDVILRRAMEDIFKLTGEPVKVVVDPEWIVKRHGLKGMGRPEIYNLVETLSKEKSPEYSKMVKIAWENANNEWFDEG